MKIPRVPGACFIETLAARGRFMITVWSLCK